MDSAPLTIQAIHCRRPEFKVTAISYNKLKQFNDTVRRVLTTVNVSKCDEQVTYKRFIGLLDLYDLDVFFTSEVLRRIVVTWR
jgi:hypothetical protein